jgi:hypothetical protein
MGVFLTNLDTKNEGDISEAEEDDGEARTENTPFIGVVSQSKNKSFIAYYGIENHSKWVFTPLFRGSSSMPVPGSTNSRPGPGEQPPPRR